MTKAALRLLPEFPDPFSRVPSYQSPSCWDLHPYIRITWQTQETSPEPKCQLPSLQSTRFRFQTTAAPRPWCWCVISFHQELVPIHIFPSPCPRRQIISTIMSSNKTKSKPTAFQKCDRLLTGLSPTIRFKYLCKHPCYITPWPNVSPIHPG